MIVHIKYPLGTSCMKNGINLMKTSISQCYVDSSHQISCYELLDEKWNKFYENKVFCNVTLIVHIKYLVMNLLHEKWNKFYENKYFAMLRW